MRVSYHRELYIERGSVKKVEMIGSVEHCDLCMRGITWTDFYYTAERKLPPKDQLYILCDLCFVENDLFEETIHE